MIGDQLLGELVEVVGADNVGQDDLDRIVHNYGKSAPRICCRSRPAISRVCQTSWSIRATRRKCSSFVDHAVAADAVIIPYGGGTSFSGSCAPPEARPSRSSHLILAG